MQFTQNANVFTAQGQQVGSLKRVVLDPQTKEVTHIVVEKGAHVISADDEHVGDIERIFTAPGTDRASHFLIAEGILFKERKLVPTEWVSVIQEDKVYLDVGSRLLEEPGELEHLARLAQQWFQRHLTG
jgi:uncharacterized protein YrrD